MYMHIVHVHCSMLYVVRGVPRILAGGFLVVAKDGATRI